MTTLLREERYVLQIGSEEYVLRAQELIRGANPWPGKCRVQLAASGAREGKKFYGATPREAAERAVDYLSSTFARGRTN